MTPTNASPPAKPHEAAQCSLGTATGGSRRLWPVLAVSAAVVAAAMLATIVIAHFNMFGYSADTMYVPALYRDLVTGTPMRHWALSESLNIVPEMPLMFAILWATGQNIGLSMVLYGLLYVFLLAAATIYLIRGLVKPRWEQAFLVFAVLFLWAGIVSTGQLGRILLNFVLFPSFHSGVTLLGVFLLGCTVRMFRRPRPWALGIIWVLGAGAGIASDPFFLVQFFVPILFCLYVCRRRESIPDGLPLRTTVLLAVPAVVIALSIHALARTTFNLAADEWHPLTIQLTKLSPLLEASYHRVFEPLSRWATATCVFSVAGFVLAVVMLVAAGWRLRSAAPAKAHEDAGNRNQRLVFCLLFFVVSISAGLLFPMLSGILANPILCRYVQPAYVFPAIILAIALSLAAAGGNGRIRLAAIALPCAGVVVLVAIGGRSLLPKMLIPPVPDFVVDIDQLHERTGAANGLSDYWVAKPTSLLSRYGVHVDQIVPWEPRHHVNNPFWYFQPGPAGRQVLRKYEFIVPGDDCTAGQIIDKFGMPAETLRGRTAVMMMYNRKSDVGFRNFLRIPLLLRVNAKPPSAIKSPPNLQEYKADGLPYDSPGCSIIPSGGSLEVIFDPPPEGDVLEVSADDNDEYEAHVRYTDGRGEALKLPVVPGNGLQRRFLSLSGSDGIAKVQGLTIRPVTGDGQYSIGHVFVYKDSW